MSNTIDIEQWLEEDEDELIDGNDIDSEDELGDQVEINNENTDTKIVTMKVKVSQIVMMLVQYYKISDKGTGLKAVYLTMNVQRFRFLVRNLRFDDFTNRSERNDIDKLAPIRELFEVLVQNFQNNFIPSEYLTLDEQLIAFRGRCSFRQYIPNKPARYGIKIFAHVDIKNAYTFNLEVYAGQQPNGPYKMNNSAESVVKRMVQPVEGT